MNLDKDRIAILLYGEYRTFDIVNTFWNFKENQNIDFYFSTWNFSYQGNDELKIDYKEKITTNSFTKYFKQNIPFLNIMDLETEMGNYNCKHEKYIKYNEKAVPIHLGYFLEMMDTTSYDYIVLTRPDVFFDLNNLQKFSLKEIEYSIYDCTESYQPTPENYLEIIIFLKELRQKLYQITESLFIKARELMPQSNLTGKYEWRGTCRPLYIECTRCGIHELGEEVIGGICRVCWSDPD